MDSISKLALEGHFQALKAKYSENNLPGADNLKDALTRAISFYEDVYEKNPDLLTDTHKKDYLKILKSLHHLGYHYKGHPDLISEELSEFPKMPMQKAGRKEIISKKKKTG